MSLVITRREEELQSVTYKNAAHGKDTSARKCKHASFKGKLPVTLLLDSYK